jgi:hypothetical protein
MNNLLGVLPSVSLEQGVRLVCEKVLEKIKNGTLK